jgi:hypothetical protein
MDKYGEIARMDVLLWGLAKGLEPSLFADDFGEIFILIEDKKGMQITVGEDMVIMVCDVKGWLYSNELQSYNDCLLADVKKQYKDFRETMRKLKRRNKNEQA